jgi:Txe/YoeB family toxin of Txe-Axe toxin-antitoxin module
MKYVFDEAAWEDYVYRQKHDKHKLKRIIARYYQKPI